MAMNIQDAFDQAITSAGSRHLSKDQLDLLFKCSNSLARQKSYQVARRQYRLVEKKDESVRW